MDQEVVYHDLEALKFFYSKHPLNDCFNHQKVSLQHTFEFFVDLAYESEDIGRCISLMLNIITASTIHQFSKNTYGNYIDPIINNQMITAIGNNEALSHGSNLNAMNSYFKQHDDDSCDIYIDKKVITNVGAADLLLVSAPMINKGANKFVILLFKGNEIQQNCISQNLHGLASCPTGSIKLDQKNKKDIKFLTPPRLSLLVMRHMYNMERFLLGCILTGILKKILRHVLEERDKDSLNKFNNQYLQDKVIKIFENYIQLESLVKSSIQYMSQYSNGIEPILSIIKIKCITSVHESIMLFKEICGGKSYLKDHVSHRFMADLEAIFNLGGTKELMKNTLFSDLQNKKTRQIYV